MVSSANWLKSLPPSKYTKSITVSHAEVLFYFDRLVNLKILFTGNGMVSLRDSVSQTLGIDDILQAVQAIACFLVK